MLDAQVDIGALVHTTHLFITATMVKTFSLPVISQVRIADLEKIFSLSFSPSQYFRSTTSKILKFVRRLKAMQEKTGVILIYRVV